jgi:dihydroorotate dehydrogenase
MKAASAYERLVRPLLFSLDPETAHHLAISALRRAASFPPALRALRIFQPQPKPKTLFGVTFPHPVGLAAGFDKNGLALPAWAALGFGFIEIGTVTAQAQPGNPRPRIFRFPQEQALINRLGFNNDGADVVAERLSKLRKSGNWPTVPVGINIGKSKVTPLDRAVEDYVYPFQRLAPLADYIALNVSSPNTPGLRSLQESEALSHLLRAIREENRNTRKPILIKIAPDLSPTDLEQIIAACEANEIAGIIATNTTIDHMPIPVDLDQAGGLSGQPLREKSTAIIRSIRSHTKLAIIASGGIFDAESAREKLEAGAELLQVYTGYIFRGPGLLREIAEQLD